MLKIVKSSNYQDNIQSVLTIGTFDGLHLGHQKILKRVIQLARKKGLKAILLTFFPHPRMVLQKDADIKLITTINERAKILEQLGLDVLIIEPFTKSFSRLTADYFVSHILVNQLKAETVIIGYDHRFGRNRSSNVTDLKAFGKALNFQVEEIPMEDVDNIAISSTKIRNALNEGLVNKANAYLGYNFTITGQVISGKKIGRNLGFPTANIAVEEPYKLIPKQGVYIVKTQLFKQSYFGMMNIGNNPTIKNKTQSIEAHFFDYTGNLYDTEIQVELLKRLRDEQKFESLDALKNQLQNDKQNALSWIATSKL